MTIEERKKDRQVREQTAEFTVREDGENGPIIEGYFAVFNSNYEIWPGATESIAPGAFTNTISDDVRALINHDTTLVLGRTSAKTCEITQDERGLFGRIKVNPNDQDAVNLYERVKRGDVDQCSFGFDIVSEETDFREDGSIHWTIKEVKLYEISCCTFPAYKETNISAREEDKKEAEKRKAEAWREQAKRRLTGGNQDGTKKLDA